MQSKHGGNNEKDLCQFLDMKPVGMHSKYMRLPLSIGQNRSATFKELEEKMVKKTQDWKNLTLSWAGRESLIKACMQSLLVYAMSCFKVPKTLCNRLTAQTIRFWWNGGRKTQGIHWTKREHLLKEKAQGGMGFKCMDCFNEALLMKQLWRLLCMPDNLLSVAMKHRYLRNRDVLSGKPKPGDSFVWRSLGSVLVIFKSGFSLVDGTWVWNLSTTGSYTVRSGYSLAYRWKMAKEGGVGEVTDWENRDRIWNRFWKVRVPVGLKILT